MNELTWLQKHEKLILGLALLLVSFFLFNKYLDHSSESATVKAALAEETLRQQVKLNEQTQTDYRSLVESLSRQNQQLAVNTASRSRATAGQQKTDAALPLPDLGQRWVHLLNLSPQDILFRPPGLTVSEPAAHKTVDQLELVPTLQANLQDAARVAANKDEQIRKQEEVVVGLHNEIDDTKIAGKKEITDVKAKARKSKRNWFVGGVIVGGVVAGYFLH